MSWQVDYAIQYIRSIHGAQSAQQINDDAISINLRNGGEAIAVILAGHLVDAEIATRYHLIYPTMDFLCGYRKECAWEGGAIRYLEGEGVGWGSAGTLESAISSGELRHAAHKTYFFSYRLVRQIRALTQLIREYDRVFSMTLPNGRTMRVGMIAEYEPTADAIRTFWDRFGPIDIAWNINPNGDPTPNAIEAGKNLGCEVVKWEQLRPLITGH